MNNNTSQKSDPVAINNIESSLEGIKADIRHSVSWKELIVSFGGIVIAQSAFVWFIVGERMDTKIESALNELKTSSQVALAESVEMATQQLRSEIKDDLSLLERNISVQARETQSLIEVREDAIAGRIARQLSTNQATLEMISSSIGASEAQLFDKTDELSQIAKEWTRTLEQSVWTKMPVRSADELPSAFVAVGPDDWNFGDFESNADFQQALKKLGEFGININAGVPKGELFVPIGPIGE